MERWAWIAVCGLWLWSGGTPGQSGSEPAVSSSRAFPMTWCAGGAGRRENMNVGSKRVYEVELSEFPPQGGETLATPGARYGKVGFADEGHSSFICGLRKPPAGTTGYESFFIDLNHNGLLEEGEVLKPRPVFEGLTALEFGAIDLMLQGATGPRKHRVFVHTNTYGPLYLTSHCYMRGRVILGNREIEAVLVDYNCDGRYAGGKVTEEALGSLGPRELDYDLIGWDANGNGEVEWTEQHFIGSYTVHESKVWQINCSTDGLTVTVTPLDLPMGRLQMPGPNAFVRLVGPLGPFTVLMPEGVAALPVGTYPVDYAVRWETPDMSGPPKLSKSGRYFEKPWTIRAGEITTIEPNDLVVTEADEQRWKAKVEALERRRLEPQVSSLLNKPLGDLREFGIPLDAAAAQQRILLCFFDPEQRPSRHCLAQLAQRYPQLRQQDLMVVAVSTPAQPMPSSNQWLNEQKVPFAIGQVKGDWEQGKSQWGIRSLPWLILTDKSHTVRAEGFALEDLDKLLKTGPQVVRRE